MKHLPHVGAMVAVGILVAACDNSRSATAPVTPGASAAGVLAARSDGHDVDGAVYTATNAAAANAVVAFARDSDGRLTAIGTFNTGGRGTGGTVDPLQSQFSLILSDHHRYLYVVNGGSHDITAFRVHRDGTLEWMQRTDSRGNRPISLATFGRRLYVLNSADSSVGAFRIGDDGTLTDVHRGGWRRLPAGVGGPSTLAVVGHGGAVLVTERDANRIDEFPLDDRGGLGVPTTVASHGAVPFGFDVRGDNAFVSEAGPGAVSSYERHRNGALVLEDGSVTANGKATCWIRLTHDGRFAFTTNSASQTLTTFEVDRDAHLELSGALATLPAGSIPIDLDVTANDRFVYTLEAGAGAIGGFAIGHDGALTLVATTTANLAPSSGTQGLAAF